MKFTGILIIVLLFVVALLSGCATADEKLEQRLTRCINYSHINECKKYISETNFTDEELKSKYTAKGISALTGKRNQAQQKIDSVEKEENDAIQNFRSSSNSNTNTTVGNQ